MDFSFEGNRGGWDNNSKRDYHFPIEGAEGEMPILHIVNTSVEMAPVAKVGGMGDVVTALSRALQVGLPYTYRTFQYQ